MLQQLPVRGRSTTCLLTFAR